MGFDDLQSFVFVSKRLIISWFSSSCRPLTFHVWLQKELRIAWNFPLYAGII